LATQSKNNRASQIAFFTKMVSGVNLHVLSAILLGGQTLSASQIVAVFNAFLQATTDLETAKTAYQQKLVAEQAAEKAAQAMAALLKAYAQGAYGKTSPVLTDFGFAIAKPGVKTVKVKAAAAEKSAATRVARNTLGSKQKESIHGTVTAPVATTIPAVATTLPLTIPAGATPGK
jgi:hypothetical protein